MQYSPRPNIDTTDGNSTMFSYRVKAVLSLAVTSLTVGLSQSGLGYYDDITMVGKTGSFRRRLQESEVKSHLVTAISLMGERHSGTNWIADHLTKCFGSELAVSAQILYYRLTR